jgi:hypothetical protein
MIMKKIQKLLFLLMLLPTLGFAQRSFYVQQDTAQILNRSYAASMIDSTQAYLGANYKEVWLTIQSTDTASIHAKVWLSADGTTYTPLVTVDSLSVAAPTGGLRTLNIKSFVGNNYFKFQFSQTAYRVPVAGTHLYTARITMLP